jgi:hypothetical protein
VVVVEVVELEEEDLVVVVEEVLEVEVVMVEDLGLEEV